jgi:hypothetical protein
MSSSSIIIIFLEETLPPSTPLRVAQGSGGGFCFYSDIRLYFPFSSHKPHRGAVCVMKRGERLPGGLDTYNEYNKRTIRWYEEKIEE